MFALQTEEPAESITKFLGGWYAEEASMSSWKQKNRTRHTNGPEPNQRIPKTAELAAWTYVVLAPPQARGIRYSHRHAVF